MQTDWSFLVHLMSQASKQLWTVLLLSFLFSFILFCSVRFYSVVFSSVWIMPLKCTSSGSSSHSSICKVTVTSHRLEMVYDQLWPKLNDCVMHCLRCHFKWSPQLTNSHKQKWFTSIYRRVLSPIMIWCGFNLIKRSSCDMLKWNKANASCTLGWFSNARGTAATQQSRWIFLKKVHCTHSEASHRTAPNRKQSNLRTLHSV